MTDSDNLIALSTGAAFDSPRPPQHGDQLGGAPEEAHEQYSDIPSPDRRQHTAAHGSSCPGVALVDRVWVGVRVGYALTRLREKTADTGSRLQSSGGLGVGGSAGGLLGSVVLPD